jgi:hypothetical protein
MTGSVENASQLEDEAKLTTVISQSSSGIP